METNNLLDQIHTKAIEIASNVAFYADYDMSEKEKTELFAKGAAFRQLMNELAQKVWHEIRSAGTIPPVQNMTQTPLGTNMTTNQATNNTTTLKS